MKVDIKGIIFAFVWFSFIVCFVLFLIISEYQEQEEKANAIFGMDARELHYDANDWFIMIDTADGHIGIYNAEIPYKHIFVDDLEGLMPGTYPVLIYDGKDE